MRLVQVLGLPRYLFFTTRSNKTWREKKKINGEATHLLYPKYIVITRSKSVLISFFVDKITENTQIPLFNVHSSIQIRYTLNNKIKQHSLNFVQYTNEQ